MVTELERRNKERAKWGLAPRTSLPEPEPKKDTILISKAKAKRLGIAEDKRRLTREELTRAETKSGQYEVTDGKTTLKRDEEVAPVKAEPVIKEAQVLPTIELGQKPAEKIAQPELTFVETRALGGFKTTEDVRVAMGTVPIFGGAGGVGGVSIVGKASVNTKTVGLAKAVVSKIFSKKALAFYGTWAGSVFLGRWGQAEAAEPITIPLRDALRQAQETGDWRLFDEYSAAAEEISNPSLWKEIALWSPLAAIPGIQSKMEGIAAGVQLLKEIADIEKERQATEETEEDKWARIYADQEQRRVDQRAADEEYYAGVQSSLERAREDQRDEDERYYAEINEENRKRKEAADAEELEEMQWKAEYYDLIRQGKYDEAAALLQSKLKGGK